MNEAGFRRALREAMDSETANLRAAMRAVIVRPREPGLVQLEVDPWSLRVTFCPLEEDLLPDDWADLPDWPESGDAILSELIFPWLAACWDSAGGRSPAYAFWHGFEARFELGPGRWLPRLD